MTKFLVLTSVAATDEISTVSAQTGNVDYTPLFCIIGLLVCVGLPIAMILTGILKYEGSIKQTLWGMIGFVVFSTMLYSFVSSIFFFGYLDQETTSFEATILIIIRIICEVAGMFVLLFFTRKKRGLGNALNFGAGYCIMECLIIGFLLAGYLIVSTSEGIESIDVLRELRVFVQDSNLVEGQEWRFIIKGFTALVFAGLQMSSAVVVFTAVQTKTYWLAGVPVIFGLLIRLPNRLHSFDSWFWGNYAIILPYLAIMTVIICVVAHILWKNNKDIMPQDASKSERGHK